MIDFSKHLNKAQLEAVTSTLGPILVIAGAGSGKTRVIEYRVLHLIQSGVSPQAILLLTFTRRAASEMLHRASLHNVLCKEVEGGTFHSFGYRMLKKYASILGLSHNVSILDEDDAQSIIHRLVQGLGYHSSDRRFPKKDTIRSIMSASINKRKSIQEVLEEEYQQFEHLGSQLETLREEYAKHKRESGYFDYDDLLIYLRELLQKEHIRKELSSKYKYIMVDEFQDTNGLQADIVHLLGKTHQNVMVVGDDAQSIYGFRGAIHKNIIDFPEMFPGTRVIKLEDNYRSGQGVLDLANAVLNTMESKFSKTLRASGRKESVIPRVYAFSDAYHEAEWMANTIKDLRDGGTDLKDQAVLFRSSYISLPLQAELTKLGIPYQVFGGLRFYEMAHVKDVLAHLRVVANSKDEVSWSRVLLLITQIGGKGAERIIREIVSKGDDFISSIEKISEGHRAKADLLRLRDYFVEALSAKSVEEQFMATVSYYHPLLKEKFDDAKNREADLDVLREMSSRYNSLSDLLADFVLEVPTKRTTGISVEGDRMEGMLTLSTIHSAKGLEWEAVFILGLMEGVLPARRSLESGDEAIQEEQRLFYVAITRAQKLLFLSYHLDSGRGAYSLGGPSRFLSDPQIIEKLDGGEIIALDSSEYGTEKSSVTHDEDGISYEYEIEESDPFQKRRWGV